MSPAIHTLCSECRRPIQQTGRGRPRRYCSDACRKAAHRARSTAWTWIEENEPQRAAVPTMEDVYAAERGHEPAPAPDGSTLDRVADTLLAADALVRELRRHSVAAAPQLALRCEAVARALDAALLEHFGDVLKA